MPVKILIGMELDVSVDNDTEPSWMKGWERSMTDLQGPLTSLTALARVFSLRTWGRRCIFTNSSSRQCLSEKTITLRRHSPLFRLAGNQLTSYSGIVTGRRLDGLTSIKLVLSWPWGAETIRLISSRILLWMSSVILPTCLVFQAIVVLKEGEM